MAKRCHKFKQYQDDNNSSKVIDKFIRIKLTPVDIVKNSGEGPTYEVHNQMIVN